MEQSALDFLSNQPVAGRLLADLLAKGAMPPGEAARVGVAIGNALAVIHAHGAVHGALSPYTIVLGEAGASILKPPESLDARARAYRAPEQVRGERPDPRSDIFSFGAVLYEMAAGVPAFQGEAAALDHAILNDQPAPLVSPGEGDPLGAALDAVIAGCMAKDPAGRRQRIRSTVLELRLALTGSRSPARSGSADRRRLASSPPPETAAPSAEVAGSEDRAGARPSLVEAPPALAPPAKPKPRQAVLAGGQAQRRLLLRAGDLLRRRARRAKISRQSAAGVVEFIPDLRDDSLDRRAQKLRAGTPPPDESAQRPISNS